MNRHTPTFFRNIILIHIGFVAGILLTVASGISIIPQAGVIFAALLLFIEVLSVIAIQRAKRMRKKDGVSEQTTQT